MKLYLPPPFLVLVCKPIGNELKQTDHSFVQSTISIYLLRCFRERGPRVYHKPREFMYFNGNTDRANGGFLNNSPPRPPLTKYRIHGTCVSKEENSRATHYDGKLVFIVVKVFHSFQTIVQIQFCARKPYWDRWKLPVARRY